MIYNILESLIYFCFFGKVEMLFYSNPGNGDIVSIGGKKS